MSKVSTKKIRVGVLFGGRSAEHEISLQSARNIINSIDIAKYEIVPIGITKQGTWLTEAPSKVLLGNGLKSGNNETPGGRGLTLFSPKTLATIDVVFPVLHGTYGEDGTMQGLLKLMNVPFVGPNVLGSAIGMDKDVMKRLFKEANIPTPECIVMRNQRPVSFQVITKRIGLPFFIKPANLGSSIGVHKIKNKKEFEQAVTDAFRYDTKVLAERFVPGREIECSVLGNEKPICSVPGEVKPKHEFYTYTAKYLDPHGATLQIPAHIPEQTARKIRALAIKAFQALCLEGMARVDFFLTSPNRVFVNEVNTIPGFTSISMYPKLWEASGISQSKLIDILIQLSLSRHSKEEKLLTDYQS